MKDPGGREEERTVGVYPIDKSMVRKFICAVCNSCRWRQETACEKWVRGWERVPMSFVLAVGWGDFLDWYTETYPAAGLHAGTQGKSHRTIAIGDVLTVRGRRIGKEERIGKRAGRMEIETFELTYENQNGQRVAESRMSFVRYNPGEAKFEGQSQI